MRVFFAPDTVAEEKNLRRYVDKLQRTKKRIAYEEWDCAFREGEIYVRDKAVVVVLRLMPRNYISDEERLRSIRDNMRIVLDKSDLNILDHSLSGSMHGTQFPDNEVMFFRPPTYIRLRG